MYHGIQKKIVTDEWLIKETKLKHKIKIIFMVMNIFEFLSIGYALKT